MKGFIVSATHNTTEDKTSIQLFGRLENNRSFVTTNTFTPYLFLRTEDAEKNAKLLTKYVVETTTLTTFKKNEVKKIIAKNQTDLNKLSEVLHKLGIDTFEADIKPHTRFLIDHNIFGSIAHRFCVRRTRNTANQ